jgi:hypothetical protein
MNTIRFFKKSGKPFAILNGEEYTGKLLSQLSRLKRFGVKEYEDYQDGELVMKDGYSDWFNYKGVTYFPTPEEIWGTKDKQWSEKSNTLI